MVLCDSIRSLAVHNNVARVVFTRLSASGSQEASLELLLPVPAIAPFVEALKRIHPA